MNSVIGTSCTKHTQAHVRQNPSMEEERWAPLVEELLTIVSCQDWENELSLRVWCQIIPPGYGWPYTQENRGSTNLT